jgi:hypothetical protein
MKRPPQVIDAVIVTETSRPAASTRDEIVDAIDGLADDIAAARTTGARLLDRWGKIKQTIARHSGGERRTILPR